jgi:putative transcriptional regulator
MKDKQFQELIESIKHAGEYMHGRRKPSRIFQYTPANVRKIRLQLGLSQNQFASVLHISVNTLQNWEQGRCVPEGPAQVLLKIADNNPKVILEALRA